MIKIKNSYAQTYLGRTWKSIEHRIYKLGLTIGTKRLHPWLDEYDDILLNNRDLRKKELSKLFPKDMCWGTILSHAKNLDISINPLLSDVEKQYINDNINQKSIAEICLHIKRCHSTVIKYLKRNDIVYNVNELWSDKDIQTLIDYYRENPNTQIVRNA